ncbi:MAG: carboxypeptidase regulatory-like domain-containing protein [Gemmatimonadota bacterium]|nr:carboxypeptidase regulatory-like domain-containing protein [Gemmatimonadota bacterium]
MLDSDRVKMPIRRLLLAAAILAATFSTAAHAQQADVIRGRVTGPDSAMAGVNVTVTSISGNVSRTARTDSNGRFTVTFPGGDGDYMVSFTALGYAPKRFEVKRTADEDILVADAKLTRVGAVLDAVTVRAEREKVRRNDVPPDVSGTEQPLSNAAVPADLMGDLAAMAASLPGIQSVPGQDGAADGYSVLGLGADQNNTTLNGMQFGGSSLPRDAAVGSSVVTSPYDVSRGGFSGAQMTLRTRSGSNFITRGMSGNVDAPQLQWSDGAARSLGQEYSNYSLGGVVSGPIKFDKSFYNVSYQLGRRANELHTLLTTDPQGLQAAGVSSDSVGRLLSILGRARVPFSLGDAATDRLADQGSVFGSLDFAPPSSTSGQALNVSFNGNWNRQSPATGLATELPGHSGDRTNWRGGLQTRHNAYFGVGILSETSLGVSASRNSSSPYLQMPAGRVRVSSSFDDGASAVQNLFFGGNQSLNSTQTTNNVGLLNQMSWFSTNNKHRLKLTTELRRDGSSLEQASNLLGTFAYNSLADLEAGIPSSYSRQLGTRQRDVSQLVGALSLGDSWRRTPNLQIQYGLRVDGNRFLSQPQLNPEVESVFDVRNDLGPDRVYLSPRVGFSWSYGTAAQIAGFEGAARGPRAVVRGGIGLFQNMPSTNLIGPSIDNTGLPGAVQQLMCVGAAAPVPDWSSYAADASAIPDRCADGTTGSVFANASPNISLFGEDYSAPRSIRSNLQWSGPTFGNRLSTSIDATFSLNRNQQSTVDLNFSPVTRFTLTDEAGRPVYVLPTSIVPATGAIASRDARVSGKFSRVSEIVSDLRSQSRQLSLRFSPTRFSQSFSWGMSYVYSNVREQSRGFNSTVGNPLAVEWGRSSFDSRHQIVYNLGYNFFDFVRVNWFGQFRSGSPFTPMVAGDVNGDGYSNDRAYVINPGSATDPALAAGIQSLLDNGSDAARSCLSKQLGHLAARNSCQSPWSSNASMSISFNPVKVRMPQRATLSFQLSNPLGAADLLFNGSGNLRGWGQQSFPDQSLLYVRGFDPQSGRYKYEVNQRFGSTNQAFGAFRVPVTLTAMLRFDVGPTRERQLLTQQLDRGRRTNGTRAPEQMLRAIYGSGGIPNPMATILRQQDSLKLTAAQADSIAVLNRMYTIRNDAVWSPVAKYFADLGDSYDHTAAYDKYIDARKATVDLMMRLGPAVKDLLTAEQKRKLPAFIAGYLDPRYLASIRNGTAGFTGGGMFSGGAPGMFASEMALSAGGGGERIIIRQ